MAKEKSIYIHAGGHRTGTSSLQMCLHENRKNILQQGFDMGYPGRDGIPSGDLGLRLPSPRHGETQQERFIGKVRNDVASRSPEQARGLILSEENIPGRMLHFFGGKFYPAAEARLKALAAGLGPKSKRAMFVVRPYDQLYISAHRKRAEDIPLKPFSELRDAMMGMDRGFPALITSMRDILQAQETIVIAMSARGDSRNLLKHLVPDLDHSDMVEPGKFVNLSATDAAMEALQARYKTGEKLDRASWKSIIEQHADDTQKRGFAEFTAAQKIQLDDRFEADCDALAKMGGITFIR